MRTLATDTSFAEEIKKSRFLASARRVDSIDEAVAFVQHQGVTDASHNCWAYQIGDAYRFSDDGEPASTAGRPIHAAIQGRDLDHVVVLISRYFGGTKLGAGGLVRAYGGCAAKCLRQAQIIEVLPRCKILVSIDFDQLGAVYAVLDRFKASRLEEHFRADGVQLEIELQLCQTEKLVEALANATHGTAKIKT